MSDRRTQPSFDAIYDVATQPSFSTLRHIRQALGPIFHELARQKECRIIEGHLMPDHVHICIEIPPKYAVASVIGYLKGKSAIAIARQFAGRDRNFAGEHFGRAVMRSPQLVLSWSKSAPTSVTKRMPTAQGDFRAFTVPDRL
jgi:hypothetical protein